MHLDAGRGFVERRAVFEAIEIEVGTEHTVQVREEV